MLHGNGLRLLLLHLLMLLGLLVCLDLGHLRGVWPALLLVLHLLLLLLNLEMRRQVDERLAAAHLLSHRGHLCGVHVWHAVGELHAHAALLLRKHCLVLPLAHKGLLLRACLVLHHGGIHWSHISGRRAVHLCRGLTHAGMLLLLLRKHVRLLWLEMRHGVCIGSSHAGLHADHGPCLADGAVGS